MLRTIISLKLVPTFLIVAALVLVTLNNSTLACNTTLKSSLEKEAAILSSTVGRTPEEDLTLEDVQSALKIVDLDCL